MLPSLALIFQIFSLYSTVYCRRGGRIVEGFPIEIKEIPYQASVGGNTGICGASIISPRWVITAAHCMSDSIAPTEIRYGANHPMKDGISLRIKRYIIHPGFEDRNNLNDIALVEVAGTINTKIGVPIKLPEQGETLPDSTLCLVSGWGDTQYNPLFNKPLNYQLHAVYVPTWSTKKCKKAYPNELITSNVICAGYDEGLKDACQGDSGGPLTCKGKLFGIVSWGYMCAMPNLPGVYTNVAQYRNWIRKNSGV